MITVTLYTRQDCHLCDEVKADLESLRGEIPHRLVEVDIDADQALAREYGERVPVVEMGPYCLSAPFTKKELQITLAAVRDRQRDLEAIENQRYGAQKRRATAITFTDKMAYAFARHYLLVMNLLVFIYVGLPFLAPVLMNMKLERPARIIYSVYSNLCHQYAFRSWFLFGEQPVYPRAAAGLEGYLTYGEATGLSEEDVLAARRFVGNPQMGYKVAYCQRDVAIYGGILLFGVVFALSGRKIRPLPWVWWIVLGILPIGLDGVTQVLSQPPLGWLPYRESTPLLRTVTGALFGIANAWLGYPMIEEVMRDARQSLAVKFKQLSVW